MVGFNDCTLLIGIHARAISKLLKRCAASKALPRRVKKLREWVVRLSAIVRALRNTEFVADESACQSAENMCRNVQPSQFR